MLRDWLSLPSEMGQVRTWVLYELRGATRAECFFILHWGHETLSFPGKSVCACVRACVCVCECMCAPDAAAAHSAAPPAHSVHPQSPDSAGPFSHFWLAASSFLDWSLSARLSSFRTSTDVTPCSLELPWPLLFFFSTFPLSPPFSPSVWTVTRLGSESSAGELSQSGDSTVALSCLYPALPLSPWETELQVYVAWCNHSHHLSLSSASSFLSVSLTPFSPPLSLLDKSAALFGR